MAPRNGSELGHWAAAEPLLCAGGALLLEGGAKAWCSGCVLSGNSASGSATAAPHTPHSPSPPVPPSLPAAVLPSMPMPARSSRGQGHADVRAWLHLAGRGGAVCSAGSFFAAQDSHFKPSFSSPYAGSGLVVATGASAFTTVANSTITVDAGRWAPAAPAVHLAALVCITRSPFGA